MYRRKRNRVKMVLAVRIIGRQSNGSNLDELTHTLDISSTGVRLGGLEKIQLQPGDVVEIRRQHRKAHFRVAWVGAPGTPRTGHAGLRSLDAPSNFWGLEVPEVGEQPIPAGLHLGVSHHEHA